MRAREALELVLEYGSDDEDKIVLPISGHEDDSTSFFSLSMYGVSLLLLSWELKKKKKNNLKNYIFQTFPAHHPLNSPHKHLMTVKDENYNFKIEKKPICLYHTSSENEQCLFKTQVSQGLNPRAFNDLRSFD